mmetsp:Transcript_23424/g.47023  ORF Transcript_23424/g.47023 Transcript_23424/m.47023 type:complete len:235 (-) Transcript_23424:270-974(-)
MGSSSGFGILGGLKKLKNDSHGSVFVTVRVPLPFLFRWFFFRILTVTFLPAAHSISVPSAFSSTGSSEASAMKYVFVSTLLEKNSFSLKWNDSLKPIPVSSGRVSEVMFVNDLRIASSFSVMLAAIMLQFCITPSQKSGTPVPSALSGFCSPLTMAARFSKIGASSASYFRSRSRISFRNAVSRVDTSSSSPFRALTHSCTGSGRLLMNSSTIFSLSTSSSSSPPSSSPSSAGV